MDLLNYMGTHLCISFTPLKPGSKYAKIFQMLWYKGDSLRNVLF